jgi:hypothetical protein
MSVLSSKNWIPLNAPLMHHLGSMQAAAVLSYIYNQRDRWELQNNLQEDGSFFILAEEIESYLLIGKKMRLKCFKILETQELIIIRQKKIDVLTKGEQTVNFFYINDVAVSELIESCNLRVGAQRALPSVPKEPANKNTTTSKKSFYPGTQDSSLPDSKGRVSWRDLLISWQGAYPDYALNVLTKIQIFAEFFDLIASHGYTKTECESFLPEIKNLLASDTSDKLWRENITNAISRGFGKIYPVILNDATAYKAKILAGVIVTANEEPASNKPDEKNATVLDNRQQTEIEEMFA